MAAWANKHRIYSKRSPEVWLAVGKLAWSQLPLSLKSRFLEGLERIVTLRDQIGAAAAVSSMPPIQVIPELWYDDDRCFDGCAGPLTVNGNTVFGCTLPAQTATLEDEGSPSARDGARVLSLLLVAGGRGECHGFRSDNNRHKWPRSKFRF